MPFGGLIRGILEKVHDSLLFPGRILLGIGKLTVFAYASAINLLVRCESFLDATHPALGIRESWVPGSVHGLEGFAGSYLSRQRSHRFIHRL